MEAINQAYLAADKSADNFQAYAVDNWDGGNPQVQSFINGSGITFPVLMNAGAYGMETLYDCDYHHYFVIGGDGVILYEGNFSGNGIRNAIDDGLEALSGTSAIGDALPSRHQLRANYPNPFNPETRIPYELGPGARDLAVRLDILDIRGRVVRTLVNTRQSAGRNYEVSWNGTDYVGRSLPSGTYISRLTVDGQERSQLLTLVK